jgi:hypothetical protein
MSAFFKHTGVLGYLIFFSGAIKPVRFYDATIRGYTPYCKIY